MVGHVYLADDGSLHASWILQYALRMASRLTPAVLHVLHVSEWTPKLLETRRQQLARLSARHGVELDLEVLPPDPDVARALDVRVPAGPEHLVIVGFRAHPHGRGLAWGTVGHALLSTPRRAVLAMRVSTPGNLGLPGTLAVALSESPGLDARLMPALRLLSADLDELVLLRVIEVQRSRASRLTHGEVETLLGAGRAWLSEIALRLRDSLAPDAPRIDMRVSVSPEWPTQLLLEANRVHAQLLLIGATDHMLVDGHRFSNPLETLLRNAACDVAVFRGPSG